MAAMRMALLAIALTVAEGATPSGEPSYHVVPGAVPLDKGPDGNSVVLDAPDGLIVVDTGRHPEHSKAILDYAKRRGRPIAAVVNTHWHLDHTTGNWDVRRAYPGVAIYASNALEGALATFLRKSREQTEAALADPATSPMQRDQFLRGSEVIDHPERIRPDHVVERSGRMTVAGRDLDVHVARFAATEGDVWLFDRTTRVAIVGDLVVDLVPFMDTACPDGWLEALDEIEQTPFDRLIPGHGPMMSRSDFIQWKKVFTEFVGCGRSTADKAECIAGWEKGAARFIDEEHRGYVRSAAEYYVMTRLRSTAEEQQKYCKPLRA
jgi:glyoxylase-like metal-dependent hydrolase (beta-lactamase superfamily II)